MMARRGLTVLLIALLAVPATASPSKGSPAAALPIGTISQSDATNVGGAGALPGTTVFSGDTIEVGPRGSASILMNGGRHVRLSSDSRVRLYGQAGDANRVEIEMEIFSGAARFRSGEKSAMVARLADATVRAKGTQPAVGLISVLSRRLAVISSEKGELLVNTAHDRKSLTLREGEVVEVILTTEQAPSQEDQKQKRRRTGGAFTRGQVAIIGGLIAGAFLLVGIRKATDTADLTNQQKQDMVSPFKFP
jgi:hypothetical protein